MDRQERLMLERIYNELPRIYRYADRDNRYQLKRFLEILVRGGLYPTYRDTRRILDLFDVDKVPAEFLPELASALGFEFPYALDEQTQRTYIRNAVISYRVKGTRMGLVYMIRELTRFKTQIEVDNKNRHIDVFLEVDEGRQDYQRLLEIVDFLLHEYAPPVKSYNIVNKFVWFEEFVGRFLDLYESTTVSFIPDNEIFTKKPTYTVGIEVITQVFQEVANLVFPEEILLQNIQTKKENERFRKKDSFNHTETDTIKGNLELRHDNWFFLNESNLNDERFLLTAGIEHYDRKGIKTHYDYDIISHENIEQTDYSHVTDLSTKMTIEKNDKETSTQASTDTTETQLKPLFDNETTLLNRDDDIETTPTIDTYDKDKIKEVSKGKIIYPDGTIKEI